MSPAKPRKKRAPKKTGEGRPKGRCKRCGQAIRVPTGWRLGPAVRKHYWAKHRDVMRPGRVTER